MRPMNIHNTDKKLKLKRFHLILFNSRCRYIVEGLNGFAVIQICFHNLCCIISLLCFKKLSAFFNTINEDLPLCFCAICRA